MTEPRARVALATCSRLPELDDDDRPLLAALADRGIDAVPAVWDDPAVDWSAYDLAVVRNPWDYTDRVDAFVAWTATVPRLANPSAVIAWNVDKRYLADIGRAGVAVIPTTFVAPGESVPPLAGLGDEVVVKPTVSAGARDTLRLPADDPAAIAAQLAVIHGTGKVAMVQPYLHAVDEVGETATIFLGGRFSHAARKGPLLPPGRSLVEGLYAREEMSARTASAAELAVAEAALAALAASVPGGGHDLLYARVDLIPDADGRPTVIEIEVTEPSLFLAIGAAVDRFADAIAASATGAPR